LFPVFAFEYLSYRDKEVQAVSTFESLRPVSICCFCFGFCFVLLFRVQVIRNFASSVSQRDLISTVKESYLDRTAGQTARSKKQEQAAVREDTALLSDHEDVPATHLELK
jgi:hypothetical protein